MTVTSKAEAIAVATPSAPRTRSASPGRAWSLAVARPGVLVGGAIVVSLVAIAITAPLLGTVDPSAIAPAKRAQPPSWEAWFGTDMLGRDIYSRVIFGTRVSLIVGFSVAVLSALIGVTIGLLSGFFRRLDGIVMRVMDAFMAIPSILLAVALMTLTGGSLLNAIVAITLVEIPRVARLIRSVVLSLREKAFIEAAVLSGTPTLKIMIRHILPNTVGPLMVQTTYIFASAIVTEAILSFIGAGVPSTTPSWGNIISEARALWQIKPFMVLFPAIFLSITVLAVNLLGDGLRDALDPKSSKRV